MTEPGEVPQRETSVDITKPHERLLGDTITIQGEQIGSSKWEELLRLTSSDGKERVMSVVLKGGKLSTGKILIGDETSSPDPLGHFLPKALFGRRIAYVHTHPGVPHIPNSALSDTDIQFANNHPKILSVMIEKGGAHLLLHTLPPLLPREISQDLFNKRLSEIGRRSGLMAEVITLTAQDLEKNGMLYYFSPDISSAPGPKTFYRATDYFAPKPQTPSS